MSNSSTDRNANYHHGDLRQALISHGLALLEADDDARLSLRQLARAAGVSPSAVYRHFANKEDLMVALAVEGFERLTRKQGDAYLRVQQEKASSLEAFRAGGFAYVHFARLNPALFRLMFGRFSANHRNDALEKASRLNSEVLMLGIRKIFGAQLDEKKLRAVCVGTWSMIHGLSALILDQQLSEKEDELDELIETTIALSSDWGEHMDKTIG
jgi:AcrR family transcriptional regulator